MTREQIRAALTEEQAVYLTLDGEAAGEPLDGQIGVACVIRNRAMNPRWWGRGYKGVCLAPSQFSCWWEDSANSVRLYSIAAGIVTGQPLGERTALAELRWIAGGVMSEQLLDRSNGADHYCTEALLQSARRPSWSRGQVPVAGIAGHVFFRLEL